MDCLQRFTTRHLLFAGHDSKNLTIKKLSDYDPKRLSN